MSYENFTKSEEQAAETARLALHLRAQDDGASDQQCAKAAAKLASWARAIGRINIEECNRELRGSEIEKRERLQTEVERLAEAFGVVADTHEDPRGYPVKLHFTYVDPKPGNTFGGAETGWGIGE